MAPKRTGSPFVAAALAMVLAAGFSSRAGAAGRATVQVSNLILEAPVTYTAELESLAETARTILPSLERDLGVRAAAPYRVFLIPSAGERDQEMAHLDALAPPWAAGFLMARARVGAIRLDQVNRYPYNDAPSVLVHEVTHMLLYDAAGDGLPRWFEEGLSTWEGRRWGLRDVLIYSSALVARDLPALDELETEFDASSGRARLAYAASFDFVSWSIGEYGRDVVPAILDEAAHKPFANAWKAATGVTLADSEASWRRGTVLFYRWLPILTGPGTLWVAITLLALVAAARRRRRSRQLQAAWEGEEAAALAEEEPDEPVN